MNKSFALACLLLFCGSVVGYANDRSTEYRALIRTSMGKITIQLLNETPIHRDNFIRLAREGFYDGLLFHRVIPGFVIQAGDPTTRNHRTDDEATRRDYGEGDSDYTLPAEIHSERLHTMGAVGAAREGDDENPERRSSGSHFYIVCGDNTSSAAQYLDRQGVDETIKARYQNGGTPHLDGAYTVFGYVIDGMDKVRQISRVPRNEKDLPQEDITIRKIKIDKRHAK